MTILEAVEDLKKRVAKLEARDEQEISSITKSMDVIVDTINYQHALLLEVAELVTKELGISLTELVKYRREHNIR